MIKRLTKREQKIFAVCFILVMVFGGYNGIYKPMKQSMQILDKKILTQESRLNRSRRTLRRANAIQKKYDSYIEKFKQTKSNEQVMSSIVTEIEQVATELNLKISDLKPKKVKREEFYNQFSVSLTIDSQLMDISHFLYRLQKDPLLYIVEELRLDKGSRRKSKTIKSRLVLSKILVP